MRTLKSPMIARLKDIDPVVTDEIHQTVLLSDPPRPDIRTQILERFWFAYTSERIAHNGFDQGHDAQCGSPVLLNPIAQIIAKLWLEHSIAQHALRWIVLTRFRQALPHDAGHRWTVAFHCVAAPV